MRRPGDDGHRVPAPWRTLLSRVAPPADRRSLLDDLDEEYRQVRRRRGVRAARRWARSQVLRSLPPLLRRRLAGRTSRPGGLRAPAPRRRLGALLQDLRYGLRSLAASPGYGALVTLVLALGIGANTAIFSLVNPFLFRGLPYEDPERLVHLFETDPRIGGLGWDMIRQSWPTVQALREQTGAFAGIGAYYYADDNLSRAGGEPEQVTVGRVTVDLFPLLGARPLHGRLFAADEGRPGGDDVLLVHESVWRSRFGADPGIVGTSVGLDGREHVIVGVMPREFNFPFSSVRMWKPVAPDEAGNAWEDRRFLTVGKLAPGVDPDTAAAEIEAVQRRLAARAPEAFEGLGARVVPLREALIFFYDQLQALMLLLLGAVVFVLLIVCANVGNLSLARASRRRREIAVRSALGAPRGRVIRQLLVESVVLALLAGALGALLAAATTGAVSSMIPEELWRAGEIRVDAAALGYTLAVSLAAAVAFGLLPARQATRLDLARTLKEGRTAAGEAGSRRLDKLLVAAQVTAATVLCGGALMMVLAFQDLQGVELGFEPEGVVSLELTLPDTDYPGGDEVRQFWSRLTERAEALPGVASAGVVDMLPLNFESGAWEYAVPGGEPPASDEPLRASAHRVDPGYFATMGIPVLRGRAFEAADGVAGQPVIMVNRLLADRHWPDGGAVGRTLVLGRGEDAFEASIVGVVAPSMGGFVFNGFEEQVFRPMAQSPTRGGHLVLRTTGEPGARVDEVRGLIAELDPELPVSGARTMAGVLRESTSPLLVASRVLAGFGGFALLLAAVGVYGVIAYTVSQRTQEIGVRMALGAHPGDVLRLVLRSAATLVSIGTALGGGLTWLLGAVLESGGFGEASLTIPLAVILLLTMVAAVAAWRPARRATRIDPAIALRAE